MRRSWSWKITFGLAAIAIGAFVIFDILDLDGSQARARFAECALDETCFSASERLNATQSVLDSLGTSFLLSSPSTASEAPGLFRHDLRAHALRSVPLAQGRACAALATRPGSPSAADPV